MSLEKHLGKLLADRKDGELYREVKKTPALIDFFSNDYLGFGKTVIRTDISGSTSLTSGSGASRLLGGYHDSLAALEVELAQWYKGEKASLFSSGYDANHGFFEMLTELGVNILYDAAIHASIRTAVRGKKSQCWHFRHNDLNDLESKLKRVASPVAVVTEGYFSMDGDAGKIPEIAALKAQYDFTLIVDEAHSTGTVGQGFCGVSGSSGLLDAVDVRIHTFGKALGSQGACIVSSPLIQASIVNFCRPYIYSTAPSPAFVHYVWLAHKTFSKKQSQQLLRLRENIGVYLSAVQGVPGFSQNDSPIQWYRPNKPARLTVLVEQLAQCGFALYGIRPPTVPQGQTQLRILLHSTQSEANIRALCDHIRDIDVF